jgi:hypothetical protein
MKPPGDPDQQEAYALARRVLLDALDALGDQRDAVVLVGAQAIYLHTGDTDLAVAPFTTDGDIAINPEKLQVDPKLEEALHDAGFEKDAQNVGTWIASQPLRGTQVNVAIDLMVPEAVGGPGRRGARLSVHGKSAARKARGLEAALVDYQTRSIEALDDTDSRVLEVAVAGPSALLVAKLHKIAERIDSPDRSRNKDALDVYRLLQSIPTETLADGIRRLLDDRVAAGVTEEAVTFLRTLFSEPSRKGCQMVASAVASLESGETIAQSCAFLTEDLLKEIDDS